MFGKAQYLPSPQERDSLKDLVSNTIRQLRFSIIEFEYPTELKCRKGRDLWSKKYRSIGALKRNREVLRACGTKGGSAGIYAIATKQDHPSRFKERWCVRYIGQVESGQSRQRLWAHLVWKKEKKGTKLNNVQDAVARGHQIGISFVEICPATLRQYVEQKLIDKCCPDWNSHGIQEHRRGRNNRCRCELGSKKWTPST